MDITSMNEGENLNRISWIDNAKGYGIILVIFAHLQIPLYLSKIIYSFHLPLFFFLSGYVFNEKGYNIYSFLNKKLNSMVKPYFSLGLSLVLFTFISMYLDGNKNINDFFSVIIKLFVQKRQWTIWFLSCLFFLNFLFFYTKKINHRLMFLCAILFPVIGRIYYYLGGGALPWNIDVCFMAYPFFYFGYELKKSKKLSQAYDILLKKKELAFLTFTLISIITAYTNIKVSGNTIEMFGSQYGMPILTYISAFIGIFSILFLSNIFKSRMINFIGRNSLLFFGLHQTIVLPISYRMILLFEKYTQKEIRVTILPYLATMLILTLCINTVIILIINNTKLKKMFY